jgi:hypothetical protein
MFSWRVDGKPALFGVSQDTTLLEFSAEKFSKAFDNSSLLMGIVNVEDAAHIDANAALCRTSAIRTKKSSVKRPLNASSGVARGRRSHFAGAAEQEAD